MNDMNAPQSTRLLPWWARVVVAVCIFTAGGAVGAVVTSRVVHRRIQEFDARPGLLPEAIVARLTRQLRLSDPQIERIREVVADRHGRIASARRTSLETVHREFSALEEEVSAHLDEAQRSRWQVVAGRVRRVFLPQLPSDG